MHNIHIIPIVSIEWQEEARQQGRETCSEVWGSAQPAGALGSQANRGSFSGPQNKDYFFRGYGLISSVRLRI